MWVRVLSWWHHQMDAFAALLTLCAGNSPVTGEFPSQRASNAVFDVFFGVSLNKRLNKQLNAGDLMRHGGHCDVTVMQWLIFHLYRFLKCIKSISHEICPLFWCDLLYCDHIVSHSLTQVPIFPIFDQGCSTHPSDSDAGWNSTQHPSWRGTESGESWLAS